MSLDGKICLVSGAAGVLGEAIARRFAILGCQVILADIQTDRLAGIAAELGENALALPMDVSDAVAVRAGMESLPAEWRGISILINNAGILSNNKAAGTTPEEWRRVLSVNLDGAFYLSQACLPHMRKQRWGRIVNICSLAMKTGGLTAGTAYTTSKSALGGLTFSLAGETAREGVTVNGVAPAYIVTPMVTEQLTQAQREELLKTIPAGRFLEAGEVAHAVAFLASEESGFITGEIIDINGGLHFD